MVGSMPANEIIFIQPLWDLEEFFFSIKFGIPHCLGGEDYVFTLSCMFELFENLWQDDLRDLALLMLRCKV
jgi:hypothetical protein